MLRALHLPGAVALITLLCTLPVHGRAAAPEPAQGTASAPAEALAPGENERRLTVAREVLLGLGFNIVAVAGALGTGLGAGALASSPDEHGDAVFLDDRGERVFAGVTLGGALLLGAPATALGVHLGDRRSGSYKLSLLSSFVGGAGLGAVTFLVAWPALSVHHDQSATSAALIATGSSSVGFLAGAIWGEHRTRAQAHATARRTQVFPVLGARHGLSIGLAGRF
jgi:hypothetical protein